MKLLSKMFDRHRYSQFGNLPRIAAVSLAVFVYLFPATPQTRILLLSAAIVFISLSMTVFPPFAQRLVPVLGLCLGLALGALLGFLISDRVSRTDTWFGLPESSVDGIAGIVNKDAIQIGPSTTLFEVRLDYVHDSVGTEAKAGGNISVLARDCDALSWGARIRMDHGVSLTLGEDESFFAYADGRKVSVVGWTSSVLRIRHNIRAFLINKVSALNGDVASLLSALLLGIKNNPVSRDIELFKASGCMHLLALSGMHLGILTALVLIVLSQFIKKRAAIIISLFFVFFYVFLVGIRSSLVRAAIMYIVAGLGAIRDRRIASTDVLAFSFIALAVTSPGAIDSMSFKLSFLALSGILTAGGFFSRKLSGYIPPIIAVPLSYSLGAQLFTAPLLLVSFGTVNPAGIVASVVLTPLITIFIWIGLMFIVFSIFSFSTVLVVISKILQLVYLVVMRIVKVFSAMPKISIDRIGLIIALYAACFTLLILCSFLGSNNESAEL